MHHLNELKRMGQSVWLDFISRDLIRSGKLKQLVADGLSGMTSNLTIFHKSITKGAEYDGAIRAFLKANPGAAVKDLYDHLVIEDIKMAADVLKPVYDATEGIDGLVSLEPPAQLAYDTQSTMKEIRRLWKLVDRPNVMMKVPATPQGIPVVETLTGEGVNVNITLMFSLKHYEAVAHAYIYGIARNAQPWRTTSVASFFVSRVDTYVDKELEKIGTEKALALRGKAAIANSKVVYRRFHELFFEDEFSAQRRRSARVQRVLWGSTSTKNPAYSDVLYVENLIGPYTVNTLPMETLETFRDHGKVARTIDKDLNEAKNVLAGLAEVGVDLDAITEQLQKDGVKAFVDSLDQLLAALEKKMKELAR